ncbi:YdcF family protein [Candidatus Uhrbacteria bacterium]|nr:YdcF family protein [Candidatus Uhrbacteria bacterium]
MSIKRTLFILGAVGFATAGLALADVQFRYADRIVEDIRSLPQADVTMVLGASVKNDGTPSDALADRLETGLEIYRHEKAKTILLTGDDGAYHTDEIAVMRPYLISLGVAAADIKEDGHGYRTYESCKNAAQAGIKKMTVVTQRFHLGRSLYLCNRMGIDTYGIAADKRSYTDIIFFWTRDLAASLKAWWDVNIWAPNPPV